MAGKVPPTEKGIFDKAVAEFERHATMAGTPNVLGGLGYAYARAGRRSEALKMVRQLEVMSKRQYVSPYDIALVYVGLGDKMRALARLERAYEETGGDFRLTFLKVDPWFDDLRDDPRFQGLLHRMNFPP